MPPAARSGGRDRRQEGGRGVRPPPPPPPVVSTAMGRPRLRRLPAPPQAAQAVVARGPAARPMTAREMVLLHELEKKLLGDDNDGDAEAPGSACGSTVTSSAWGDTMQELNSITAASLPSLPMASTTNNYNNTVPITRHGSATHTRDPSTTRPKRQTAVGARLQRRGNTPAPAATARLAGRGLARWQDWLGADRPGGNGDNAWGRNLC
uniref:Uncharacterized protein n=1 Tax=Setaria viridis TaxID=4556 RepID=A0A4U6TJL4_SETVI|nr:hypothetical protein SEVIR_8G255300v2 [Setaria viridis]